MRVIVTGAAGFIGSHLTEACLDRGWEVVAVDVAEVVGDFRNRPNCVVVHGDLAELDLGALIEGVDIVFHLAAVAGTRESWGRSFDRYMQANAAVLHRLLEAARAAAGLRGFVFASSSSVYGDPERFPTREDEVLRPVSPYGATKVLGEQLCRMYFDRFAVPVVTLRYFSVYGPRQRPDMAFHRAIRAGLHREPFRLYGDGHATRDFTYVDDVVAGTLAAGLEGRPGEVYNLGGGSRRSIRECLEMIREELPDLTIAEEPGERGEARNSAADITKAKLGLGYAPGWDVATGLREQIRWHRNRV